MTRIKTAFRISIVLVLCACGVRETTAPDGAISREIFVGAVEPIDCSQSPGHSARLVQIGAWVSATNAGAGYHQARYFCGAPHCQLTVWADNANRADLEELAKKYHGICIANKEGRE